MNPILIAEDDPLIARMYQKIFTLEHYQVEVASNGQEAIDKVRQIKPVLVLLDVMMPQLNGLQVLEKIKSDPDTRSTPVIMLTNLSSEHDAEAALLKGAVKYIVKSQHEPKEIVAMVKEILAATTRDTLPPVV